MNPLYFACALGALAATSCTSLFQHTPRADSELHAFFEVEERSVVTFVGYSGAGYEDHDSLMATARAVLDRFDPSNAIINIGATPDGIGAIYGLAKERGFETTGIVSSQARAYDAAISPHVDHVFFVEDETWGGFLADTGELSPTSRAIIDVSHVVIGIGGGEVARDELMAARAAGKNVEYHAADMDHAKARAKAERDGRPAPTSFRGAAAEVLTSD